MVRSQQLLPDRQARAGKNTTSWSRLRLETWAWLLRQMKMNATNKIRNPKLEIRNKFEIRIVQRVRLQFSSFGIRICFDIRVSDFEFSVWAYVLILI